MNTQEDELKEKIANWLDSLIDEPASIVGNTYGLGALLEAFQIMAIAQVLQVYQLEKLEKKLTNIDFSLNWPANRANGN